MFVGYCPSRGLLLIRCGQSGCLVLTSLPEAFHGEMAQILQWLREFGGNN